MEKTQDRDACDRRLLLTAGAALAGWHAITPLQARTLDVVGLVKQSQADAYLKRNGARLAAASGGNVFLKDIALTGDQPARLELRLGTATRIRLGANATLEIERFVAGSAATLDLKQGPALVERDHGAEPKFTLHTPYALLAARGTTFFAGPSKGVFGIFVREGVVDVRTAAGAVTLRAGQGTDIAKPGAAPTPVKIWAPARVQAALDSVS